jgi:malonate transporter
MLATFNASAPIALIILTGYLLNRYKVAGAEIWSAVEHVCFYILFPFLIIRTLSRADFSTLPLGKFVFVVAGGAVGMAFLLLFARPILASRYNVSGPTFTSLFQGATRFHGFMALAIIGTLYGDQGLALGAVAISVLVPILNTQTVAVLTIWGTSTEVPTAGMILLRIAKNPLIWGCIAGMTLNLTGVPAVLFSAITIIGDGGLGLAMMAVGASLHLNAAAQGRVLLATGVVIRLIGMPLLMMLLAWLTGLTGIARAVAIIAGAVPTASTAYVMARKMGGDAELMANLVTFQVVAAGVTLPVFIYLADHY